MFEIVVDRVLIYHVCMALDKWKGMERLLILTWPEFYTAAFFKTIKIRCGGKTFWCWNRTNIMNESTGARLWLNHSKFYDFLSFTEREIPCNMCWYVQWLSFSPSCKLSAVKRTSHLIIEVISLLVSQEHLEICF